PEALANSLAFLQIDLTDPDFHQLMLEHSRATLAGYRALLDEAVAAGELIRCDTGRLARVIGALAGGALLPLAGHREGPVTDWLRSDFETLLKPLRTAKKAQTHRAKPPSVSTRRTSGRRR